MPNDGLNIAGVQDPTAVDQNLFVAQTNEATDPNLLVSMQTAYVQPANGFAMEEVAPGITEAFENAEVTVTANPELLDKVDMAGMLPATEPNFGGGGLFADIMGAVNGLAQDVANAADQIQPQQEVVAEVQQPQMQQTWTPPANAMG